MHVVLVAPFKSPIPPKTYGGTQRDVYWLAKGLSDQGHQVTVLAPAGSYVNEQVRIIETPTTITNREVHQYLPHSFDIVNFHNKLNYEPDFPYLHSMHGNAKVQEWLPQNTSFISHRHALNHGGKHYVYNGLDLDEYPYYPEPADYFSFLGRISWKRKNVRYARHLAKKTGIRLHIGGGWRVSLHPRIHYRGMVGGQEKLNLLGKAKGFMFPTAWEEPMGLVVAEAMASGTPCIVSDRGAMPELVNPSTGFVCCQEADYLQAIQRIDQIDRQACRERVRQYFSKEAMANGYVSLFSRILNSPEKALQPELDINAACNRGNDVRITYTPAERIFYRIKALFQT